MKWRRGPQSSMRASRRRQVGLRSPSPDGSCQAGLGLNDTRRRGGPHAPSGPAPARLRAGAGQLSAEALGGAAGTGEAAGRPTTRAQRPGPRVPAGGAAPRGRALRRLRLFPSAAARPGPKRRRLQRGRA